MDEAMWSRIWRVVRVPLDGKGRMQLYNIDNWSLSPANQAFGCFWASGFVGHLFVPLWSPRRNRWNRLMTEWWTFFLRQWFRYRSLWLLRLVCSEQCRSSNFATDLVEEQPGRHTSMPRWSHLHTWPATSCRICVWGSASDEYRQVLKAFDSEMFCCFDP